LSALNAFARQPSCAALRYCRLRGAKDRPSPRKMSRKRRNRLPESGLPYLLGGEGKFQIRRGRGRYHCVLPLWASDTSPTDACKQIARDLVDTVDRGYDIFCTVDPGHW
jgi:hypothetical protein